MKVTSFMCIVLALVSLSLPACHRANGGEGEQSHEGRRKIVATSPKQKDLVLTEQYVCRIHAQNVAKICALANGYIQEVLVKEGQPVKKGEVMYRINPKIYNAKLNAELAEVRHAQLEYDNTKRLFDDKNQVVSQNELLIYQAKLGVAQAKAELAAAEMSFTEVKAPFDGLVDHLHEQTGTLVKEGEALTSLSDVGVMRVYYNVPEIRYYDYVVNRGKDKAADHIELLLANGSKFKHNGTIYGPLGECDPRTGNFTFRADFPNPDNLLRNGQTGNVQLHKTLKNGVVIPQRATFEVLDRRYVYLIDKDSIVHQHEIVVEKELEDVFVIKSGLTPSDKFVLEGVRQVHDGEKLEFEYREPDQILANQKNRAE